MLLLNVRETGSNPDTLAYDTNNSDDKFRRNADI